MGAQHLQGDVGSLQVTLLIIAAEFAIGRETQALASQEFALVSKPQAAAGCLQTIAKNAALFGTAEENRRSLRVRLANHAGYTGFDYSGFLRGNLSKRMPEQVSMIHADIGDHTQYRLDNIGGIQQSSQADFDHGYIHLLLC